MVQFSMNVDGFFFQNVPTYGSKNVQYQQFLNQSNRPGIAEVFNPF